MSEQRESTSTSIGSIKDSEFEGVLGFVGPFTIRSGKFGKYLTIKNSELDKPVGQIIEEMKEASAKRAEAFKNKTGGGGGGSSSSGKGYAKPYGAKPAPAKTNNDPKGW
jgi:topoisomerase IA-like protein